jgi:hypothetical protein
MTEIIESLNYTWVEYNKLVHFVVGLGYYSNAVFLSVSKDNYIIQHHTLAVLILSDALTAIHTSIWIEMGTAKPTYSRTWIVRKLLWFREYSTKTDEPTNAETERKKEKKTATENSLLKTGCP